MSEQEKAVDYTNIVVSKDEWFTLRDRVTRLEGARTSLVEKYVHLEKRYDEVLRQFAMLEKRVNTNEEAKSPGESYQAMETALSLLTGNILNLRTELLVIKAAVVKEQGAGDEQG